MPTPRPLTDKSEIRRRLNRDREWSLYALADLDDGMFAHCDWWALEDGLILVFRALEIRPIFVLGDAQPVRKLLAALPERAGYLNLKPEQLTAAEGIYQYRQRHEMRRCSSVLSGRAPVRPKWKRSLRPPAAKSSAGTPLEKEAGSPLLQFKCTQGSFAESAGMASWWP